MIIEKAIHQQPCVAFAGVCRMRADRADFAEARNGQALASHGDEFALDADAVVGTHLICARAEETWESEIRERDHCRSVFGGQAQDLNFAGCPFRWRRQWKKHLEAVKRRAYVEFAGGLWLRANEIDALAWGEQLFEWRQIGMGAIRECGQGDNVCGVANGRTSAHRKARMHGVKSIPHEMVKKSVSHIFPWRLVYGKWPFGERQVVVHAPE